MFAQEQSFVSCEEQPKKKKASKKQRKKEEEEKLVASSSSSTAATPPPASESVAETGVKAYQLLLRALEEKAMVGIAKVAIREREYLATVRADEGVIILETMYWPDEIREPHFETLEEDIEIRVADPDQRLDAAVHVPPIVVGADDDGSGGKRLHQASPPRQAAIGRVHSRW